MSRAGDNHKAGEFRFEPEPTPDAREAAAGANAKSHAGNAPDPGAVGMAWADQRPPEDINPVVLPPLHGRRIRKVRSEIVNFHDDGFRLVLEHTRATEIRGPGDFATYELRPSLFAGGAHIRSEEQIVGCCPRYSAKRKLKFCGPLTSQTVRLCARCGTGYCLQHVHRFLLAKHYFCGRCFWIRGVEAVLTAIALCVLGLFRLLAFFWCSFFKAFER